MVKLANHTGFPVDFKAQGQSGLSFVFWYSPCLRLFFIPGKYYRPDHRNEDEKQQGKSPSSLESVSNVQTDISNLERINRWKCAIRMFKDRPITGFGPGTYQFVYYRYQVKNEMTRISTYHGEKGNAHSEYLGSLCETGLPGLLIYLVSVFLVLYTAVKIIYKTKDKLIFFLTITITLCLLTFYIHTVFNGFLDNDKIGSLYYGSLGAITAIDIYFFRRKMNRMIIRSGNKIPLSLIWIIPPALLFVFALVVSFNGLYGQDSFEYLRFSRALHTYFTSGSDRDIFSGRYSILWQAAILPFLPADILRLGDKHFMLRSLTIIVFQENFSSSFIPMEIRKKP